MLKSYEISYILDSGVSEFDFNIFRRSGRVSLVLESETDSYLTEPDFEHGSLKKWILQWPSARENRYYIVSRSKQTSRIFAADAELDASEINHVSATRALDKLRGIGVHDGRNGSVLVRIFFEDLGSMNLSRTEYDRYKEARRMARTEFRTDRILEVRKFRLP